MIKIIKGDITNPLGVQAIANVVNNSLLGGVGIRYKCLIRGQEKFIYYEGDNKWFVEAKEAMVQREKRYIEVKTTEGDINTPF